MGVQVSIAQCNHLASRQVTGCIRGLSIKGAVHGSTLFTQPFRLAVSVRPEGRQPRTILTSELYNAKGSAEDGIESVKKNSALDERYQRKDSSNGKPMFNLKASNGQVIGTSELYSSESARDEGIASMKANGPTAVVDDQT
jgi:uncharacterized protein YegP (UPF0339 family)